MPTSKDAAPKKAAPKKEAKPKAVEKKAPAKAEKPKVPKRFGALGLEIVSSCEKEINGHKYTEIALVDGTTTLVSEAEAVYMLHFE